MKNKRLTILCVAVVALAGSPRVWHETGKLLAIVQHKAQVKFWSLVLQPGDRESSNVELATTYKGSNARSVEVASTCALEQGTRQGNQAKALIRAEFQPGSNQNPWRHKRLSVRAHLTAH